MAKANKSQYSAAFLKVFGASLKATAGKSADHFVQKRIRTGKSKRDRGVK